MIVKRTSRELPVSCGRLLGLEVIVTEASGLASACLRDLSPRTSDRQTESHPSPLLLCRWSMIEPFWRRHFDICA